MLVRYEGGPLAGTEREFDPLSEPGPCGLWDGRIWTAKTAEVPVQLPYAEVRTEGTTHVFRLLPEYTVKLATWAYVDKGTIDLATYELVVGWALAAELAALDLPALPVFDWVQHRRGIPVEQQVAALRRRADELESASCTGLAASWCPVHGDCTCPKPLGGGLDPLDDHGCPLHARTSSHAEAASL